jgi:arylsulfatase
MEAFPEIRRTIDATHDFTYENIGRPGSYTLLGPNWANAGAPAFRLHKAFPTEGGTRVAAFVHYPQKIVAPAVSDDFVFVKDVAPTILELAGVEHPSFQFLRDRARQTATV